MRDARPASALRPPWWSGPLVVALALVAAAGVCAALASRAGLGFLSDLNLRQPALARHAPPRRAAAGAPLSRRVVLVIIDGLGAARADRLPVLDRLRRDGTSGVARSHLPSLSRPNYASIATGVPPRHSGVRSNDYRWAVPLDSLLARARAAGLATALVTDDADGFAAMFAGQLGEVVIAPWAGEAGRGARRLLARGDPLVVVILSGVDDAGHHHGAASAEYRAAALAADRAVGELVAALDLSRDTVVVTADHGHTGRGGHGGAESEVMRVPLVMAGAGVRRGARLEGARLIDIAPTVAALLGVPAPGHALGATLTGALDIDRARVAALAAADRDRLAGWRAVLAEPPARWSRAVWWLGALLAAAAAALVIARIRRLDRRAALLAAGGFPAAALALAATVCRGQLSLSALASHSEARHHLLLACAALTLIHLASAVVALRGSPTPRERLACANRAAAVGLGLAIAAVAAAEIAAILGGHAMPSPAMLLAIPLLRMSLAGYALAAGVTLVVEIALFVAATAIADRIAARPFAIR